MIAKKEQAELITTETNNTYPSYTIFEVHPMAFEKCDLCSGEKCTGADLVPCDFKGDNFKECLRYRLYFTRTKFMQLR